MNRRSFLLGGAAAVGSVALLTDDEIVDFYAPKRTYVDLGKNTRPEAFDRSQLVLHVHDSIVVVATCDGLPQLIDGQVFQAPPGVYNIQIQKVLLNDGRLQELQRRIARMGNV